MMALRQWNQRAVVTLILLWIGAAVGLPLSASDPVSPGHEIHDRGGEQWEGSLAGKAYSERNHQYAGLFLLLIGLSELGAGWRSWLAKLGPMCLPAALVAAGVYLLIWSDHEAWPIGRLSLAESFWGPEREIVQHKWWALLSITVGVLEFGRLTAWLPRKPFAAVLPLYAVAGGALLFTHDHGAHPQAGAIARYHLVIGLLAVLAGSAKFIGEWFTVARAVAEPPGRIIGRPQSRWGLVWTACVTMIGILLLLYRE